MEAVDQLESGPADADLGGGVYKVRIARPGEGKSGGYRVIVFFKSGNCTFYIYGFAKADLANINKKELKAFKEAAHEYFLLTSEQLNSRVRHGQLVELQGAT
jgi:hypothetical protein